jgi:hypothetical protein
LEELPRSMPVKRRSGPPGRARGGGGGHGGRGGEREGGGGGRGGSAGAGGLAAVCAHGRSDQTPGRTRAKKTNGRSDQNIGLVFPKKKTQDLGFSMFFFRTLLTKETRSLGGCSSAWLCYALCSRGGRSDKKRFPQ